jgi:hypothetical protein
MAEVAMHKKGTGNLLAKIEHPHQAPDPFFHSPLWIKLLDLWSWGVISATSLLHIPKRS